MLSHYWDGDDSFVDTILARCREAAKAAIDKDKDRFQEVAKTWPASKTIFQHFKEAVDEALR